MDKRKDEIEIDLKKLFKALWHRAWAIVLAAIVFGVSAFSYTNFLVTPLYKASALMYVNNSMLSVGNTSFSITPGELAAAQSLVETYVIILKSRTNLNEVIRKADLDYSYEQLSSMVSAESLNETEIFRITVTSSDPNEAELIVNTIAEVLPEKISDIVDGSSVRVVDYAVVPTGQSSPNVRKNTLIGILAGVAVSCGIIVVLSLMDVTIRDDEYLTETYGLPVLAVIPELSAHKSSGYGYYRKRQ